MEFKHFSHHHGLVSHHIPPTAVDHRQCNGCNFPLSGNLFACWTCNYFLHDHCFRATRSLKHPSHPHHPLTLLPYPTYPSASFLCNSCHASGHAFSYSCSLCEFDLHVHCANASSNHAFNPNLLNSSPIYPPVNPPAPAGYPPANQNLPPAPAGYPPVYQNLPPAQNYPPQNQNLPPAQNYTPQNQNLPPVQNYPPQNPPVIQNPAPVNYPPPPPPQQQPNPTIPTYSTVVNATSAGTTAPPVNPPAEFPQPSDVPQQAKPPSIIRHFSHPHILKAMDIEKGNAKVCSACECALSGPAYCCTEAHCTFNLHKLCFDSAQEVKHKAHLQHPLKLLTAPPYKDGFTCNACLKDGKAFCYTCEACSYDLHIDCVQWPDTVIRPDHPHPLTLYYSSPAADMGQDVTFVCDVCKNPVHELAWVYYCRDCDFGTHLDCIATAVKPESSGGGVDGGMTPEELAKEMELQFAMLKLAALGRKYSLELI